jgi:hypothetical protein
LEKNTEYNVYIDESGDEGIKRGSEWFILTAIIVPKEYDLTLSNKIVNIKEKMKMDRKDQLHWNKILKYDKKIQIIYDLIAENFKIIHIAINTFEIEKLKSKDLYPYFMSYLIERVSYYVYGNKGKCNIFISTRQDNNKQKNEYLKNELTSKKNYHHIKIECIQNIKFIDNRERNLLQLADVCCSSFAQAIKYNTHQEWEYVLKLKANIWNYKNHVIGYGIKFYPPLKWFERFPTLLYLSM